MISALYRPEAVVQIPTQSHMVSEYVHGCVRLSACRIVICQPMQRDGGRLVRAVFITNYSPRTGFMIPQEREPWYNRRGPKPCACFAVRPLLIHHKRSFSGQLSPIFVRTKDLVTAGRPDRCWGKSKRRGFIADRSQKDVDLHLCVVAFNVPIHRCGRRFLGSEMLEQFNDTKVSTDLKIIPRGKIYSFWVVDALRKLELVCKRKEALRELFFTKWDNFCVTDAKFLDVLSILQLFCYNYFLFTYRSKMDLLQLLNS